MPPNRHSLYTKQRRVDTESKIEYKLVRILEIVVCYFRNDATLETL